MARNHSSGRQLKLQIGTKPHWALGIITIILALLMRVIGHNLVNHTAPAGIVSFELAGKFADTQQILASWNIMSKISAGLSLGLDFLFIFSYAFFLAFSIFKIAGLFRNSRNWLTQIGLYLGWAQFLAGFSDILENISLIRLLLGSQNALYSTLAYYFASLKFILIILGIFYIFGALSLHLVDNKFFVNKL